MAHSVLFVQGQARKRGGRPALAAAMVALLVGLAACSEEQSADAGAGGAAQPGATQAVNAAQSAADTAAAAVQDQGEAANAAATSGEAIDLADKGYALGDIALGSDDAPITMIEYASLTCPACQAFHQVTVPVLKREFIDTGKVRLIVRELHGARIGLDATALARCGGADKYHPFLNLLFSRQENYLTQDRAANLEELRRIGKVGGLSADRIEACLGDEAFLNALYQDSREKVEADEVPATPYLILQPGPGQETIRGAVGPDELRKRLEALLDE